MPDYLLEGGMVNLWFAGATGPHPNVEKVARSKLPTSRLLISAISIGEIEYGHACCPAHMGGPTRQAFMAFLKTLPTAVEVTHHTAEVYGELRAALVSDFPPLKGWGQNKKKRIEQLYDPLSARELGIDENDLWITAQAIERNLVLVTDDKMTKIKTVAQEVAKGFGQTFEPENWKNPTP